MQNEIDFLRSYSRKFRQHEKALSEDTRKFMDIMVFADTHLPQEPKITHIVVKDLEKEYKLINRAWVAQPPF